MLAERVKEWTHQWKQEGLQEGLQEGMKEGLQEGRHEGGVIVLRTQLLQRFNLLPPWAEKRLQNASQAELNCWTLSILDAKSLEEVFLESG